MSGSLNIEMYEALIDKVLVPMRIEGIPGDFLDLGCMMGGGTELLGRYAAANARNRKVWAVDAFDFGLDRTVNSQGHSMEAIYRSCAGSEATCYESFLERTRYLNNIELFVGDSREVALPDSILSFAFVDCGHSKECIFNDFDLAWRRLSPGGIIALHDFGGDLPEVTLAICQAIRARAGEIEKFGVIPEHWIIWIQKLESGEVGQGSEILEQLDRLRNSVRLVVASYREDLAWTTSVTRPICVYDASGESCQPGAIVVENRAREAGQYLHHIVSNYPNFYEWEVFVQGNPFDHCNAPVLYGEGTHEGWLPFQPLGRVASFNSQRCEHDQWAAKFALEWLGAVPEGLPWSVGAQFAVSRRVLLNRSLDYWRALQKKTLDEELTSPWALERLWAAIF